MKLKNGRTSRALITLLPLVLLAGCNLRGVTGFSTELSARLPATSHEEDALIANLQAAYEKCEVPPWTVPENSARKPAPKVQCVAFKTVHEDKEVLNYLAAGLTLSDYACDQFFRETNQQARRRQYTRQSVNDASAVVTAILGAVKAGSVATGLAGSGFASLESWFGHFDDAFLVSPDLAKMRRLVLAAQDKNKAELATARPTTYFDAEAAIIRYAGHCSFLGMQEMLNDSIGNSTKVLEAKVADAKKDQVASGATKDGANFASASGGMTSPGPALTAQPKLRLQDVLNSDALVAPASPPRLDPTSSLPKQ